MSTDDSANLVLVPKLDERWRYVSCTATWPQCCLCYRAPSTFEIGSWLFSSSIAVIDLRLPDDNCHVLLVLNCIKYSF